MAGSLQMPTNNSSNGGQQSSDDQQQYSSDIHDELDELFRQDPQQVKDEIRKFISERHISQSAIAKATRNGLLTAVNCVETFLTFNYLNF